MIRFGGDAFLHAAGYLTAIVVAVAELSSLPLGRQFAWTAGLMAAFIAALAATMHEAHRTNDLRFVALALAASGIGIAVIAVGASPGMGGILFFVLCVVVSMRLPAVAASGWIVAATAAILVVSLVKADKYWLSQTLSYGVGYFAMFAIALSFRRAMQARAESQQLLAELTSAQGRLRDLAVMEERQRLAREMHDAVGHRLTAAAMLLEGAARLISSDAERARRMVETSREQVRQGLDELRGAVSALSAEARGEQSIRDVLGAIVEVFAHGSEAKVTLEIEPGLAEPDPDRKLVLVRTSQEALTNVQKHASATRVELGLRLEAGAYLLTCRDNGRGIAADADAGAPGGPDAEARTSGFGLRNMRARADVFVGRVDLEPVPGGGAVLRLTLPAGLGGANGCD
jgi:signal transduction histidine kinase